MKRAVLFVDVLGVQKMWRSGGAVAVKERIEEFNTFVTKQLPYLPDYVHRDAEFTVMLGGDSVAILCQDVVQAVEIGIHLFEQAFYSSASTRFPFWLRGAISEWNNQYSPISAAPIFSKGVQVGKVETMEDDYLRVLALEKSGYRGMRIIIERGLGRQANEEFTRLWSDFKRPLYLITQLREMVYPPGGEYSDVLWMANDELKYGHFKGIMAQRFKASVKDSDEMMQAAWTRATFDMVDSLVWSCKTYTIATSDPNAPPPDAPEPTRPTSPVESPDRAKTGQAAVGIDLPNREQTPPPPTDSETLALLIQAVTSSAKADGWSFLGQVGHELRKVNPEFDHKTHGFEKFIVMMKAYWQYFDFKEIHDPTGPIHDYVKVKDAPSSQFEPRVDPGLTGHM
ncbi:MAG: OST-HTH/LOTUS domain-containing protein [Flavobacteriales bacterium]|nr:OST-HTH/LOTUS domain-containing protein [Flavobacteriales bacterium]